MHMLKCAYLSWHCKGKEQVWRCVCGGEVMLTPPRGGLGNIEDG